MNSEKGMYTFNRLEKKYESWISWMIVKQNKVKIILHKKLEKNSNEVYRDPFMVSLSHNITIFAKQTSVFCKLGYTI